MLKPSTTTGPASSISAFYKFRQQMESIRDSAILPQRAKLCEALNNRQESLVFYFQEFDVKEMKHS